MRLKEIYDPPRDSLCKGKRRRSGPARHCLTASADFASRGLVIISD
jgi:hypothetical protein